MWKLIQSCHPFAMLLLRSAAVEMYIVLQMATDWYSGFIPILQLLQLQMKQLQYTVTIKPLFLCLMDSRMTI